MCRFSHTKQLSVLNRHRLGCPTNLTTSDIIYLDSTRSLSPTTLPTSTLIRHWTHTQIQRDILAPVQQTVNPRFPRSLLRFNNLLKGSQNSVLLPRLLVYCKDVTQEEPDREMHRARYGRRGTELAGSHQVKHPPSTSMCSPTWSIWTLSFWDFMEVSLCRDAWLMKSLATGDPV